MESRKHWASRGLRAQIRRTITHWTLQTPIQAAGSVLSPARWSPKSGTSSIPDRRVWDALSPPHGEPQ